MAAVEEEFGHWTIVVIATLVGVIMASGSGTGGGAIYTAIYLFVFRDPHRAVPFSKITILGVAMTSFILNVRKRHPKSDRFAEPSILFFFQNHFFYTAYVSFPQAINQFSSCCPVGTPNPFWLVFIYCKDKNVVQVMLGWAARQCLKCEKK